MKKSNVKKSALIFDCDGVLVNSEEIVQTLELELLAAFGLNYDRDDFTRRFLGTSDAYFFAALSADAEERLGQPLPSSFPATLKQRARDAFKLDLRLLEGVRELITTWRGQLAVASSSSIPALAFKLAHTGIADCFGEHVYSADHVAAGKPDPAIYLHTVTNLGVDPEECVVVEDSVNGVIAAKSAGIYTVGFVGGRHCTEGHNHQLLEAGADIALSSMIEIKHHLH